MSDVKTTNFRDLITRNRAARQSIEDDLKTLSDRGARGPKEHAEKHRLLALSNLPDKAHVDPLLQSVRHAFNQEAGKTKTFENPTGGVLNIDKGTDDDWVQFSLVLGLLALDGADAPRVVASGSEAVTDTSDPNYPEFVQDFYRALGEMRASFDLAKLVLPILQAEGDPDGSGGKLGRVDTQEFAAVIRNLRAKGVTPREAQLRRRVNEALDQVQASQINPSIQEMSISLPDFNLSTEYEIQEKNVEAFGPMICAAMLDELKAFEVVDKLVELSQIGVLPTGLSGAGKMLYDYWKSAPNRMSDAERRNFYALTMGIPGGSMNGAANRDFNDLWIRFVSSVSNLVRQRSTDFLLRANIPNSLNQQQVRKAARDLALNLSSHGYGMVAFAARDLQQQINTMIELLGHAEIKSAYGARDMWQVIDQVAALELGGARNSARYRTLATCGAIITKWLSKKDNIKRFNSATSADKVIDVDEVISSNPRSAGPDATKNPTDYDLVNACELWLADTAVSEDRVEELSQPRESPVMTSRPIQIPSIAKDILSQSLPPGLGLGLQARR